ncbi:hypothetical protein [Entomohabitans teleogrylli]|uniref:hypothetical protein n=1 Tax=Entomohabitans teleogrylli TaxID=1384589 RepID=UPI000A640AFA|nr:hypothetical protein [Entomohabitans teleogrylli]
MTGFRQEIDYLRHYFQRVQHIEKPLFAWLWLSPEQRIERLTELMSPTVKKRR